MKLKLFVCLLAMIALLPLQAVVIVENGKSDYQIVVPESCGNKRLDHFVHLEQKGAEGRSFLSICSNPAVHLSLNRSKPRSDAR